MDRDRTVHPRLDWILLLLLLCALLCSCGFTRRDRSAERRVADCRELIMHGQIDEAIEELDSVIAATDENASAFLYRGIARHFREQYEAAAIDFERAKALKPSYGLAQYWSERNRSVKRHAEIARLYKLTETTGDRMGGEENRLIVEDLLSNMRSAARYRSQIVVRDPTCRELPGIESEVIKWSFEYVGPDRFSVMQHTVLEDYPNGRTIQWISDGSRSVTPIFDMWATQNKPIFFSQIETFLALDKYVEILSVKLIEEIDIVLSLHDECWVLGTDILSRQVLGSWPLTELRRKLARSLYHLFAKAIDDGTAYQFQALPVVSDAVTPYSIAVNPDLQFVAESLDSTLTMWIDFENALPLKAAIDVSGILENGDSATLEIIQIFSDFNGHVQVVPPSHSN